MATNSKREQIIEWIVGEVESLQLFNKVTRSNPAYNELGNFADTEFPVASIIAGLPQRVKHEQGRAPGGADVFISQLDVVIFVWENVNESIDTRISELADELWVKMWEDPTKNNLVIATDNFFGEVPTWLRPYVTFNLTCRTLYKHTRGGI